MLRKEDIDLNYTLAQLHPKAWFGWKTHEDNGDKIPNDERMTLANVVLTDKGKAEGYSIPTQSEVDTKMNALKAEIDATANNKTSGKAKLKSGDALTDAEISALFGD